METTRTELMGKALYLLNAPVQHAAMLAAITGAKPDDLIDDEGKIKLVAAQLFAQALFGEEIICDPEHGFMFKGNAEDDTEDGDLFAAGVC